MVRRIGLTASALVLGASAVVMLFGAADAVADSSRSARSSTPGKSTPDNGNRGNSDHGNSNRGSSDPSSSKPSISDQADDRKDEDNAHEAPSSLAPRRGESTSDASSPGELSTSSNGAVTGGPTVGGRPANTGAGGTEAVSASTAPTPPNGAEPSAAGSPAAAVFLVQAPPSLTPVAFVPVEESPVASAPVEESAAAPSVPAEGSGAIVVPDIGDDALDASGPRAVATGLSPDAHQSGVFVAILAAAVLLFLAVHQIAGRRDHGLAGARDAERVARFR